MIDFGSAVVIPDGFKYVEVFFYAVHRQNVFYKVSRYDPTGLDPDPKNLDPPRL